MLGSSKVCEGEMSEEGCRRRGGDVELGNVCIGLLFLSFLFFSFLFFSFLFFSFLFFSCLVCLYFVNINLSLRCRVF